MPSSLDITRPPTTHIHPHQLGVQDFAAYALVIDARSRARFEEDHIPNAVSLPKPARRATAGAEDAAAPMRLRELAAGLSQGSPLLLYAGAGERSLDSWADWLRGRGFVVDVLAGGWPNYRRWVESALEAMPRTFTFRVLAAGPASGVECVVEALCDLGEQVLDLGEGTAEARWPGVPTGERDARSQHGFESWLVHALRHRETHRRLWLIESSAPALRLPPSLVEATRRAPRTPLVVPIAERARTWLARLSQAGLSVNAAVEAMKHVGERDASGRDLSARGSVQVVLERLLESAAGDASPHTAGGQDTTATLAVETLSPSVARAATERLLAQLDAQTKP